MNEGDEKPDLKNAPRQIANIAAKIDRLPPHSIEAEQGVIGCLLLSPNDCIGEASNILKCGEEAFYDLRHRSLYHHIGEMANDKGSIDLVTLAQYLKDRKQLDQVGGLGYLASLPDAVPSAANLEYYLNIVWEKYLLRHALYTAQDLVGRIYSYEGDLDMVLDHVEKSLIQISSNRQRGQARSTKELVQSAINKMEQYFTAQGKLLGVPTGFIDLDNKTLGLQGGDYMVIAARPSVGKTSLAMNIAEHVSVDLNLPVGVFEMEMSADMLMLRMISSRARVPLRSVQQGSLGQKDFEKLTVAAGKITNAPLHIDETSSLSINELRSKARVMWQTHGIKLFVIDYIQLMNNDGKTSDNRNAELTKVSTGIKALAKDLNVPFIVLAQLNRDIEKRKKGAKPSLADIRECGSIEQDADIVALLYKPTTGDSDDDVDDESESQTVICSLAKNRNGPKGSIELTFLKNLTRFESAAKISNSDVPSDT